MPLSKRTLIVIGASTAAVVLIALGVWFFVFRDSGTAIPESGEGETMTFEITAEDMVRGNPDAPITVIEYASMTCGHCAAFEVNTLPKIDENYINKGHVRWVFRDFPLDSIALAGSVVAHCLPKDQFFGYVDLLYRDLFTRRKEAWAFNENPKEGLIEISRRAGLTREQVEACLANQDLITLVRKNAETGNQRYGVNSTPSFFINGQKITGSRPYEDFEAIFKPLLPEGTAPAPEPAPESTPAEEPAPATP